MLNFKFNNPDRLLRRFAHEWYGDINYREKIFIVKVLIDNPGNKYTMNALVDIAHENGFKNTDSYDVVQVIKTTEKYKFKFYFGHDIDIETGIQLYWYK